VVTTHFREVFDLDLLSFSGEAVFRPKPVAFYQMEVMFETTTQSTLAAQEPDEDAAPASVEEVVPLFRLIPGQAASSYGLACAKKAGLNQEIVSRASAILGKFRSNQAVLPIQAFIQSSQRLSSERSTMKVVQMLLKQPQWVAAPSFSTGNDALVDLCTAVQISHDTHHGRG
jgi:DNA mismatch repair ATPase MutS